MRATKAALDQKLKDQKSGIRAEIVIIVILLTVSLMTILKSNSYSNTNTKEY